MAESAASKDGDAPAENIPLVTSTTLSKRFMEGPLSKWTNVVNGWQYRWFVLDQSAGLLSYYTSKDKMKRGSRRGCFRLKRAIIGIDDEDDSTFTIRVDNRVYHFQAQNSDERQLWVSTLDTCIRRLHQPTTPLDLSLPVNPRQVSLDQLVSETEGYHQLIHQQVQKLFQCLSQGEEATQLRDTSRNMLEALRQCILAIKESQLMEETTPIHSPTDNFPSLLPQVMHTTSSGRDNDVGVPKSLEVGVANLDVATDVMSTVNVSTAVSAAGGVVTLEVGSQCKEVEGQIPTDGTATESSNSTSDMDNNSDEEFFDAEMEGEWSVGLATPSQPTVVSVPVADEDPEDVEEDGDYDEENNTSDAVQANKSVIMHMLSQVRVGMDLTRIVLPTFILEKRSLLEMYADFLAHPDLFAVIPDHSDPFDRIVAITRYYLSSFHAARKGTIAKKPYNPILGETFECYWDLPNATRVPPSQDAKVLLETGPTPYASYNSVTFVAEQVSHHPPISGFYAECPSKNMYANGSIWTKSKFLGLSLGVHLVGNVSLHLLDFDEVYTCNLPNAYGRSIMTVPWLELGGKVSLSCEQTGYAAAIEFHCKPFYGGRKHKVTADIFHTSDKKVLLRVEGEWNGVMMQKFANGDEEPFVDTINTPIYRKKLRCLSAQDPGESRRRWEHVTNALRGRDVEAATDAKHLLEEKQRAGARERKEKGEDWQQKLFHLEGGDTWVYNDSLDKRTATLHAKTNGNNTGGGAK